LLNIPPPSNFTAATRVPPSVAAGLGSHGLSYWLSPVGEMKYSHPLDVEIA
jgi:hypothetical protein